MQLRYVAADSDEGRHLVWLFAKCVSVRKCRTGWSYKHTYKEIWQKDTWSDCLQNVSHQGNAKKVDIWSDALILLLQELLQMAKWCDWHSTVELEVTLKESCLTKGLQVQQDSQDLHMFTGFTHVGACPPPPSGCSCSLLLGSRVLNNHVPPSVCWRIGGFTNQRTSWVKYLANRSASSIELFTYMRWAASCS